MMPDPEDAVMEGPAQQLVAHYVQMSYPLIRWLESITPKHKKNQKQLINERLYWVGTYECVQQLAATIVDRGDELDIHTVNEIRQQSDDITEKWNQLTDKSVHVVMDVDASDNSVSQVYVQADKPIGRVTAFEPMLYKYSHQAKWASPSPDASVYGGSEGYGTIRSTSQLRPGSEDREYKVADVSSSTGQTHLLECNATEYNDSGLQQQTWPLRAARLAITGKSTADTSNHQLQASQLEFTEGEQLNTIKVDLPKEQDDPFKEEKHFRISGKVRATSPPPIRHEVGPHTPKIYKISDIKFSGSNTEQKTERKMEQKIERPSLNAESHPMERETSNISKEDVGVGAGSRNVSRKKKFRIDGKLDDYPQHDPEEWYEVDSGYDQTPEGVPLSPTRSRSNSPAKREKSEPLMKQAKSILSDTGASLVVGVESFRRKRDLKPESEEEITEGDGDGTSDGEKKRGRKRRLKTTRSPKNFTFWRTNKKTGLVATTTTEAATTIVVEAGTEDKENEKVQHDRQFGKSAKELVVDTGIVISQSFRKGERPEVQVRVKADEKVESPHSEEEVDLKTSSLRGRHRKSGRKFQFWRYRRTMEQAEAKKESEDHVEADVTMEEKVEKAEKEIPSPIMLSRESTFRMSGKRRNHEPHAKHEVTGGIIRLRSRSSSLNKADTPASPLGTTTEGDGNPSSEKVSRGERMKNQMSVDVSKAKVLLSDTGDAIMSLKPKRRKAQQEESTAVNDSLKRKTVTRNSGRRFNYFWRTRNRSNREVEGKEENDDAVQKNTVAASEASFVSNEDTPSAIILRESTFRMSGKRNLIDKPKQIHEVDAGDYNSGTFPRDAKVNRVPSTTRSTGVKEFQEYQKQHENAAETPSLSLPEPASTPIRAEVQEVVTEIRVPATVTETVTVKHHITTTSAATPVQQERSFDKAVDAYAHLEQSANIPVQTTMYMNSPDSEPSKASTIVDEEEINPFESDAVIDQPPSPPPTPVASVQRTSTTEEMVLKLEDAAATRAQTEFVVQDKLQKLAGTHPETSNTSQISVIPRQTVNSTTVTPPPAPVSPSHRPSVVSATKTKLSSLLRNDSQTGNSDKSAESTVTSHLSAHHEINDGARYGVRETSPGYAERVAVTETVLHEEDLPPEVLKYMETAEHSCNASTVGDDDGSLHKIIIVKEIYCDRREKFRISGKRQKGYRSKNSTLEKKVDASKSEAGADVAVLTSVKKEAGTKRAFSFFNRSEGKPTTNKELTESGKTEPPVGTKADESRDTKELSRPTSPSQLRQLLKDTQAVFTYEHKSASAKSEDGVARSRKASGHSFKKAESELPAETKEVSTDHDISRRPSSGGSDSGNESANPKDTVSWSPSPQPKDTVFTKLRDGSVKSSVNFVIAQTRKLTTSPTRSPSADKKPPVNEKPKAIIIQSGSKSKSHNSTVPVKREPTETKLHYAQQLEQHVTEPKSANLVAAISRRSSGRSSITSSKSGSHSKAESPITDVPIPVTIYESNVAPQIETSLHRNDYQPDDIDQPPPLPSAPPPMESPISRRSVEMEKTGSIKSAVSSRASITFASKPVATVNGAAKLETDIAQLKIDNAGLKTDNAGLKRDLSELKTDNAVLSPPPISIDAKLPSPSASHDSGTFERLAKKYSPKTAPVIIKPMDEAKRKQIEEEAERKRQIEEEIDRESQEQKSKALRANVELPKTEVIAAGMKAEIDSRISSARVTQMPKIDHVDRTIAPALDNQVELDHIAHRLAYIDDQLQPLDYVINALNEPVFTRKDMIESVQNGGEAALVLVTRYNNDNMLNNNSPSQVYDNDDDNNNNNNNTEKSPTSQAIIKEGQRAKGIQQLSNWLHDPEVTEIGSRPSVHNALKQKKPAIKANGEPKSKKSHTTVLSSLLQQSKRVFEKSSNDEQRREYLGRMINLLNDMVKVAEEQEQLTQTKREHESADHIDMEMVDDSMALEELFMSDFMDCWQVRIQARKVIAELCKLDMDVEEDEQRLVEIEAKMDALRARLFNALKHRQNQKKKLAQMSASFEDLERQVSAADEDNGVPISEQLLRVQLLDMMQDLLNQVRGHIKLAESVCVDMRAAWCLDWAGVCATYEQQARHWLNCLMHRQAQLELQRSAMPRVLRSAVQNWNVRLADYDRPGEQTERALQYMQSVDARYTFGV